MKSKEIIAQDIIKRATEDAQHLLAKQAQDAISVIGLATAEALKVTTVKSDKDTKDMATFLGSFSEFKTNVNEKFADIKSDIKEVKDNIANRISNLENEKLNLKDSYPVLYKKDVDDTFKTHSEQIDTLKTRTTQIMTVGGVLAFMLGLIQWFLSYSK